MTIGVISAFVLSLAANLEIITSSVVTSENNLLFVVLAAIAGGFGERTAPSILRRFHPEPDKLPTTGNAEAG